MRTLEIYKKKEKYDSEMSKDIGKEDGEGCNKFKGK